MSTVLLTRTVTTPTRRPSRRPRMKRARRAVEARGEDSRPVQRLRFPAASKHYSTYKDNRSCNSAAADKVSGSALLLKPNKTLLLSSHVGKKIKQQDSSQKDR